ncbi:hypothetical protein EAF04_006118 [Stromatinia cepivora]|nr:hypothetical protein EAF04_006118 [Stromatinia cepivora]
MTEKEQAFVPGVSSRRSACDRCRSQKLRCLREQSESGNCDRCTRVQARCITSPIYRMCFQAPAKDTGVQKRRRYDSYALPIRRSSKVNITASMVSPSDELEPALSWNDWSCLDLSGPAIDNTTSTTENVIWDPAQAAFDDLTSTEDAVTTSLTYPANSSSPLDFSTPFAVLSPLSLSSSSTLYTIASDPLHLPENNTGHYRSSIDSSSTASKHRHTAVVNTKRLCGISSDLITQSALLSHDDITMSLSMLMFPPLDGSTNPANEIMKSIREFLRAINDDADQTLQPARESSPGMVTSLAEHNLFATSAETFSINTLPDAGFDAAALLLILTCYIHLLHAYVVLFEKICSFLQQVVVENGSHLQAVPGVFLGHLEVESGNLQATLSIQMALNIFEKVERRLSLPPAFRIDPQAKNSGGLLSQNDFGGILEIIVAKEEEQLEYGIVNGMTNLRRCVHRARELLKDDVSP